MNRFLFEFVLGEKAEAQYLLSIYFDDDNLSFGVCIVDCTTSQFLFGHIKDGLDRGALRTVLAQIQPREVVYSQPNLPQQVKKMLRHSPCPPKMSPFPDYPDVLKAKQQINHYYADLPEPLQNMNDFEETKLRATGATLMYLKSVLLDKAVISFGNWKEYAVEAGLVKQMVLDAPALRNLEILETSEGEFKNSLLDFLNHTSTKFGFRLFKRWLCSPLICTKDINNRLDCVEFFINNAFITESVKKVLKQLKDVERMMARVYAQTVNTERGAVIYADVIKQRLSKNASLLEFAPQNGKIGISKPFLNYQNANFASNVSFYKQGHYQFDNL